MTKEQLQIESLILVALAKLFNEQSTYLIGELKNQTKMNFNIAVSATNNFVKGIETRLDDSEKDFLQNMVIVMNDGLTEMRTELNKKPL